MMTLKRFEDNIVLRLANQVPTRYWKHWNYPTETPWLMAFKIPSRDVTNRFVSEMSDRGISYLPDGELALFTCERDRANEAESIVVGTIRDVMNEQQRRRT